MNMLKRKDEIFTFVGVILQSNVELVLEISRTLEAEGEPIDELGFDASIGIVTYEDDSDPENGPQVPSQYVEPLNGDWHPSLVQNVFDAIDNGDDPKITVERLAEYMYLSA